MTAYVTTSKDGSQLARLIGPERRYGTDGYRVIRMANGMFGDGFGRTEWVERVYPADMTEWTYSPLRNTWTRACTR